MSISHQNFWYILDPMPRLEPHDVKSPAGSCKSVIFGRRANWPPVPPNYLSGLAKQGFTIRLVVLWKKLAPNGVRLGSRRWAVNLASAGETRRAPTTEGTMKNRSTSFSGRRNPKKKHFKMYVSKKKRLPIRRLSISAGNKLFKLNQNLL